LVIEAPASPETVTAQVSDVVYRQMIRPLAAIRSLQDITVHYKPDYRKAFDLLIPANTIFLQVSFDQGYFFCTARSEENSFWDHYDVAVCIRDQDKNGEAEEGYVAARYPHRLRSVLELGGDIANVTPQVIRASYEDVPVEALPRFTLRIILGRTGGILSAKRPAVSLRMCAPLEIVVPLAHQEAKDMCAYLDWVTSGLQNSRVGSDVVSNDFTSEGDVSWGPLKVHLKEEGNGSVSVTTIVPISPGPAVLYDRGEMLTGTDFANAVPIVHLQHGKIRRRKKEQTTAIGDKI
jgi:hypothetical protein